MPSSHEFVDLAVRQSGDRYRFGAEVRMDDPDPDEFDCSELLQWVAGRLGLKPTFPDGSWLQLRHAHKYGTEIPIPEALGTRGALLFRFRGGDPLTGGRPSSSHVAVSLGDNRTIEARSRSLGVGVFGNARARDWTHAALIPGLTYPSSPGETPSELAELPSLRRGASGLYVARLQGLLLAHGYGPEGLVKSGTSYPDGIFGPGTERETEAFQNDRGIGSPDVTICGPATWTALLTSERR